MSNKVFHKEVWFSGHVQGVGFRYTVRRTAQGYEVTGSVKNLADGRVFLQAEGTQDEVNAFITEVRRQLASHIREAEEREFWGEPQFADFRLGT